MASTDFIIHFTYYGIGDHHLLVHMQGCKINQWMLLDLAEISSKTGKGYEEIIAKLLDK